MVQTKEYLYLYHNIDDLLNQHMKNDFKVILQDLMNTNRDIHYRIVKIRISQSYMVHSKYFDQNTKKLLESAITNLEIKLEENKQMIQNIIQNIT